MHPLWDKRGMPVKLSQLLQYRALSHPLPTEGSFPNEDRVFQQGPQYEVAKFQELLFVELGAATVGHLRNNCSVRRMDATVSLLSTKQDRRRSIDHSSPQRAQTRSFPDLQTAHASFGEGDQGARV
jgi:hypothetical protein